MLAISSCLPAGVPNDFSEAMKLVELRILAIEYTLGRDTVPCGEHIRRNQLITARWHLQNAENAMNIKEGFPVTNRDWVV